MSRRAALTQADMERAIRAVRRQGLPVSGVEVDPATGKIIILTGAGMREGGAMDAQSVVADRLKAMVGNG